MTSEPLRFGVFVPPQHPLGENPTLLFERDLDVVALCDRLVYRARYLNRIGETGLHQPRPMEDANA